jgi:hypothetical protein
MSDHDTVNQDAFLALQGALDEVSPSTTTTSISAKTASNRALKLCKEVEKDDIAPKFAQLSRLDADVYDPQVITRLRLAALAAAYIYGRLLDARALPADADAKLPKPLVEAATALRLTMLKVCRFYLDAIKEARLILDDVERGRGYVDLASDLERLAYLYQGHSDVLAADSTIYKASDATLAHQLDAQISDALGEQRKGQVSHWIDRQARVLVLLRGAYDDVAATGQWLLRSDPAQAQKRFPPLHRR